MRKLAASPVKRCVTCGTWFTNLKESGGRYYGERWAAKVTCSNSCHAHRRWERDRELPSVRFWRQVQRGSESECWPWLGGTRDGKGYGGFALGRSMMRSHRMAYILTHGPIPANLVVMHSCDRKPCCNPKHLKLGTVAQNNLEARQRVIWRRRGYIKDYTYADYRR